MDVVSVYPSPGTEDKFWLFLVMAKPSKKQLTGRWFLEEEKGYALERRDKVNAKTIMRLSKEFANFYVLPKHHLVNNVYVLDKRLRKVLEREWDSLLNTT